MRRRRSPTDFVNVSGVENGTQTVFNSNVFPNVPDQSITYNELKQSVKSVEGYYTYIYRQVSVPTTTLTLNELKHSGYYTAYIIACRSGEGQNCSTAMTLLFWTETVPHADDIKTLRIVGTKNNTQNLLQLSWDPPKRPNGAVLAYMIKYTNRAIEDGAGQLACIQAKDFNASNNIYNLKLGTENGNYSVEVQTVSMGNGYSPFSAPLYYKIENPNHTVWYALGATALFLALLGGLVYYYMQNKKREKDHRLFAEVNPDYDATPYIPDEYEIPRERVKRDKELGQGSFGMVYAGSVQLKEGDTTETKCAIKTVNDSVSLIKEM